MSGQEEAVMLWDRTDVSPLAPRCNAAGAVCAGSFYLFGGKAQPASTSKSLNDLYRFDSKMRTWELISLSSATPPVPRHSHTLVAYEDNQLILFGGIDGNVTLNDVWVFSIEKAFWRKIKPQGNDKPKPVCLHTAVVYKKYMYVYGGWMTEMGKIDKIYSLDLTTFAWDSVTLPKNALMPERRFAHIATVHDDSMYVFGGTKGTASTNEMWDFNLSKLKWTNITATNVGPTNRKMMSSVKLNNNWLIIGGCLNDDVSYKESWQYSFERNEWALCTSLKTDNPLDSHVCEVVQNEWSDFLILTTGRLSKTAITNDTSMVSIFKTSALASYEENHLSMQDVYAEAKLPSSSLEELALTLHPVIQHGKTFGENVKVTLKDLVEYATVNPDPDTPDALAESILKLTSISRILKSIGDAIKSTVQPVGVPSIKSTTVDNDDGEQVPTTNPLHNFLLQLGLDDENTVIVVKAVNDENAKSPIVIKTLTESAEIILKAACKPLGTIETRLKKIWEKYIQPKVMSFDSAETNKAVELIKSLDDDRDNLQQDLGEVSYQLTDVALPIRDRKTLTQKRMQMAKDLLLNFSGRITCLVAELNEPATLLDDVSSSMSSEGVKLIEMLNRLKDNETAKLTEIDSVCAKLSTMQEETTARRAELENVFTGRRIEYAAERTKLIQHLKDFSVKTTDMYNQSLANETHELLDVEKRRREENELNRLVTTGMSKVEAPLKMLTVTAAAYDNGISLANETMERLALILDNLRGLSNNSAKLLADDIITSGIRFPAMSEAFMGTLEKSLELQEKALKKLQGQMVDTLAKLELLENVEDPEDLAADEVSDSSFPMSKQMPNAAFEPLLSEALSYGMDDTQDPQAHSPYQKTLHKYNQSKLLDERLQSELDHIKEQMEETKVLQDVFNSKITSIRESDLDDLPANSQLRSLLNNGYTWNEVEASVSENLQIEDWLKGFYNVDRSTAPPPMHRDRMASNEPAVQLKQMAVLPKRPTPVTLTPGQRTGGRKSTSTNAGKAKNAEAQPPQTPRPARKQTLTATTPNKRNASLGPSAGVKNPPPAARKPMADSARVTDKKLTPASFAKAPLKAQPLQKMTSMKIVKGGAFNADTKSVKGGAPTFDSKSVKGGAPTFDSKSVKGGAPNAEIASKPRKSIAPKAPLIKR